MTDREIEDYLHHLDTRLDTIQRKLSRVEARLEQDAKQDMLIKLKRLKRLIPNAANTDLEYIIAKGTLPR